MESKDIGAYLLYSNGTVFKKGKHGFMKGSQNSDGYIQVCIYGKLEKLHRVIAKAFIPNPENKRVINHKNGIKIDNRVENLEWCTHSENVRHAFKTGLAKGLLGSRNPESKLSEDQIRQIKAELQRPYRGILTRLSERYGVTIQCISLIKRGKNWSHILS